MNETHALITAMNISFGVVNLACIAFWAGYFFATFKVSSQKE